MTKPAIGLYFISGARKSYNLAKTLALAGCKVYVRVEPTIEDLLDIKHRNYVDTQYCAWLYSDNDVEVLSNVDAAPPVDALVYEMSREAPRYPEELRSWVKRTPKVSAWNSSWHEGTAIQNLRSELDITRKFFEFLPRTRSVVMHNGRIFLRPTAIFSRAYVQGAFVHPRFLYEEAYRNAMFGVEWLPETPRAARLIFAGDAASPRRSQLVEQVRRSIERRIDVCLIEDYAEAIQRHPSAAGDRKVIHWFATHAERPHHIPMIEWPAVLRNSDFCFCPPGYEQKSHRVLECMLQGSIPILHCPGDYDIGMVDGVNSLIVRKGDWNEAVTRALNSSFSEVVQMRRQVAGVARQYLHHQGSAGRWLRFLGMPGWL